MTKGDNLMDVGSTQYMTLTPHADQTQSIKVTFKELTNSLKLEHTVYSHSMASDSLYSNWKFET